MSLPTDITDSEKINLSNITANTDVDINKYISKIMHSDAMLDTGILHKAQGFLLESLGPKMFIGEMARVEYSNGKSFLAENTAINGNKNNLMPYEEFNNIDSGARVIALGKPLTVSLGDGLLGRVLDGLGRVIDDYGTVNKINETRDIFSNSPDAMKRRPITDMLETGVKVIDSLLPIGKGQRIGIFAGSGVGKSSLLGMIARNSNADVNVIALIGERGREVREFIENELGAEGLKKSVIVVSTSDKPALARLRGAYVANTIAEYFRDQGKDVMLLFDSITRFAMAQREIGLLNGEVPASRGYTPSVFSMLPKILERSGTSDKGSITGIYTVLVEGDDLEEPISDTVRGTLDGHIVLSRKLAEANFFPAVDVLKSISRLAPKLQDAKIREQSSHLRRLLSAYEEAGDLIKVGAYIRGSDHLIDEAIAKRSDIENFLKQDLHDISPYNNTLSRLSSVGTAHK